MKRVNKLYSIYLQIIHYLFNRSEKIADKEREKHKRMRECNARVCSFRCRAPVDDVDMYWLRLVSELVYMC